MIERKVVEWDEDKAGCLLGAILMAIPVIVAFVYLFSNFPVVAWILLLVGMFCFGLALVTVYADGI